MSSRLHRIRASVARGSLLLCVSASAAQFARGNDAEQPATPEDLLFYTRDVRPVLEQHCFKCHGGREVEGGLRLTTRASLLNGGDSGPPVDLEKPEASLLLEAVNYQSFEMPPTGKLPQAKIDVLTKWVRLGVPVPADAPEVVAPAEHGASPQVNDETRNHWSFRPLLRPVPPAVKRPEWVANPVDAFILSRLEQADLSPNPPADRRTLMRRVHYDLLGLPPSPEEVEEFARDAAPDAYERLIERLLESPHYGEHWARYWLDVVRYGESNSYERDNPKPFVWRYRDYVIQSLNNDKPYDRFVLEQLAGDELDDVTPDSIIATGFYRLGLWDDEPADPELAFFDGLDDIAATTSQAFLGLTMNCCRCHEHKLDPIPHADYYRFVAFFRNVRHYGVRGDDTVYAASVRSFASPEEESAHAAMKAQWERQVSELRQQLDAVEESARPHLRGGERDDFQDESSRLRVLRRHIGEFISQEQFDAYSATRRKWTDLRRNPPRSGEQALCVTENGADCPPTYVLLRGNPHVPGDEVQPGFPEVLSAPEPAIVKPASGLSTGRRRALAEWIVSPQNPLAARVMANRIWQWHFGRGIVRSTNNFGLQGDSPTHPELLDWLAAEFVKRGWSLKEMHRLILKSNTYRMASRMESGERRAERDAGQGNSQLSTLNPLLTDAQNDLFWRFDMRRLRAEEIRDSILAVNGTLNLERMYGPSMYPVIPKEVLAGQSVPGQNWGNSPPEERNRRSIYIHIKRSLQVPILAAFDAADTDFTCPVRFATTQPTQALSLLNSDFLNEEAAVFAEYVRRHAGDDPAAQVALALQRAMQREPTAAEVERGVQLMQALREKDGLSAEAALKYFCVVALNLNEFVYLD